VEEGRSCAIRTSLGLDPDERCAHPRAGCAEVLQAVGELLSHALRRAAQRQRGDAESTSPNRTTAFARSSGAIDLAEAIGAVNSAIADDVQALAFRLKGMLRALLR
jgi:hypothetical protein